tara:strand:+ start:1567 stop:2367 length:801 start_codon:yes stop_codon:yes gene_type:complete
MPKKNKTIAGYPIEKGISVYCPCGNREDNLRFAIDSWLKCEEIDEIVIVDWNSDTPVSITHPKIVLVRVPNVKWKNSAHALNLGARFTRYDKICKLDVDYVISRDFFKLHELSARKFFAGDFKQARDLNERHLHGFLYTYRADFFTVNGFTEKVETYGWEDTDMYERLVENGFTRVPIDKNKLYHLRHDDAKRVANAEDWWIGTDPDALTHQNKEVCKQNPWTQADKMMDFSVWEVDKNEGMEYYCPKERINKLKQYFYCEPKDAD